MRIHGTEDQSKVRERGKWVYIFEHVLPFHLPLPTRARGSKGAESKNSSVYFLRLLKKTRRYAGRYFPRIV